jgi:hypothetical protein
MIGDGLDQDEPMIGRPLRFRLGLLRLALIAIIE